MNKNSFRKLKIFFKKDWRIFLHRATPTFSKYYQVRILRFFRNFFGHFLFAGETHSRVRKSPSLFRGAHQCSWRSIRRRAVAERHRARRTSMGWVCGGALVVIGVRKIVKNDCSLRTIFELSA